MNKNTCSIYISYLLKVREIIEMFNFRYCQKGTDYYSTHNHLHSDRIELLYVISGEGTILINDSICHFSSGQLSIFDRSAIHAVIPDAGTEYVRNKLVFTNNAIDLFEMHIPNNFISFILEGEERKKIESLFAQINDLYEDDTNRLIAWAKALEIFHIAINKPIDNIGNMKMMSSDYKSINYENNGILPKLIKYINDNAFKELTIDSLSKEMHISKYYMCHKFKNGFGITIRDYILNLRISHAQHELYKTEKSIFDIACDNGFRSNSSFCKIFKKKIGETPSEYRKNIRKSSFDEWHYD